MRNFIVNVKYKKSSINFSVKAYNRKEAVEQEKKKLVYRVKREK